jgi:pyruvate/2-oxoglutarate dehydrogenase complex dihydrolipoamide dehydrogenase (E3) component
MAEKVDVVVLGMGPGGEEVAGRLAEAGLKVVGIEKELLGGECPYWGCVPSKMMIRAADLLAEARRIPGIAGSSSVKPDWTPVARRILEQATDYWNDKVAVDRFEGKGGQFVRGVGRITDPLRVAANGMTFEASRAMVVATGTAATIPPIPGLADVPYWTNRQAIEVEQLPESLIVLGGGAIGLELAQVFARFGVRVTVVEALPRLLAMEEPEAGDVLSKILKAEGMDIHVDVSVKTVERHGEQIALTLEGGQRLAANRLLVATGRQANLKAVGLDTAGIDTSQRFVRVDDYLRAADKVWAVGDVTGKGAFTHVALYQADIAVKDILGEPTPGADYRALPRDLHRPGGWRRRADRGSGQEEGDSGRDRDPADPLQRARLDPRPRKRWVHKGCRGCRPRSPGRGDVGWAARRRPHVDAGAGRSGRDPCRAAATPDLRIPDVLPGYRRGRPHASNDSG